MQHFFESMDADVQVMREIVTEPRGDVPMTEDPDTLAMVARKRDVKVCWFCGRSLPQAGELLH